MGSTFIWTQNDSDAVKDGHWYFGALALLLGTVSNMYCTYNQSGMLGTLYIASCCRWWNTQVDTQLGWSSQPDYSMVCFWKVTSCHMTSGRVCCGYHSQTMWSL